MRVREAVIDRMKMGKMKYGHGVRIMDDTVTWGTVKNSWLEMASEELLDAIIYVIADYLRTEEKIHDEEAKDELRGAGGVPSYIPEGQDLRVLKVHPNDEGCPCGGTHVNSLD